MLARTYRRPASPTGDESGRDLGGDGSAGLPELGVISPLLRSESAVAVAATPTTNRRRGTDYGATDHHGTQPTVSTVAPAYAGSATSER